MLILILGHPGNPLQSFDATRYAIWPELYVNGYEQILNT